MCWGVGTMCVLGCSDNVCAGVQGQCVCWGAGTMCVLRCRDNVCAGL